VKGGLLLAQFGARRTTRDIDILGRAFPGDEEEVVACSIILLATPRHGRWRKTDHAFGARADESALARRHGALAVNATILPRRQGAAGTAGVAHIDRCKPLDVIPVPHENDQPRTSRVVNRVLIHPPGGENSSHRLMWATSRFGSVEVK